VLNHSEVEAVFINTPHFLHAPQAMKAAEKGKHIIVQKPMTITTKDAVELVEFCKKKNVKLSVTYSRRPPLTDIIRDLVDKGAIGKVTGYIFGGYSQKPEHYWSGGYSQRVTTDWRTKRETAGGGLLLMNYCYTVDMLQNVLELEPQSVFAHCDTFNSPTEVEDYFSVTVRYKNGAIGTMSGSSATPGGMKIQTCIFGTEGTIQLGNPLRVYTTKNIEELKANEWNEIPYKPQREGYAGLIDNFAKAVRGKEELIITGESAISSTQMIEAAYRSHEIGKPVIFD